jgi:putative membrane protein
LAINGYINVDINSQAFAGLPDPKPIFMFPVVFGGITLFFAISTLISMLIEMFKDDYTLLAVLGASRFQLSFLVGGQLFIISSLVSFVAYLFSIPITSSYYYFLQYFFGKNVLPDIQFQMSLLGCVLTVLLISLLAFFSGCYYTFKGIKEKNTTKLKHILSIMIKGSLLCTLIMIWGALFYQIFQDNTILMRAQLIFNIVILDIVIIYQVSPYLQILFIKLFSKLIFRSKFMFISSKWNLLSRKPYIKSVSAAIIGAILLISSFQMISQNILAQFQNNSDLEMKVSFIVYVGAPILIVLGNIISIAFLSSYQEKSEINQFEILGVSNYQMILVKLGESLFLTIVIAAISLLLTIKILALIYYSLNGVSLKELNYSGLIFSNITVSTILFVLLFLTKSFYFIYKTNKNNC